VFCHAVSRAIVFACQKSFYASYFPEKPSSPRMSLNLILLAVLHKIFLQSEKTFNFFHAMRNSSIDIYNLSRR